MKKIIVFLFVLLILPLTLFGLQKIQEWRKGAAGVPANIVVDTSSVQGRISQNLWQGFGQGGEESEDMLAPVIGTIAMLQPKIIRIDHLFDHYDFYHHGYQNGRINFAKLDQAVSSILQTGAVPMFSLSYTPAEMSINNQVAGQPKNWQDWQDLVKELASRYSGKNGFNINNVYYEVWNEPDLFGKWHYAKNPNYLSLYFYTVKALESAGNLNPFKIGGPATTQLYPAWIKALLRFAEANSLRLDFISWHCYSISKDNFLKDVATLNNILEDYPPFLNIERIISEWGPDSKPSPYYDNKFSAIHALSMISALAGKVHRVLTFEIKDGPGDNNQKYHSGWGLLTHESFGPPEKKPRFFAFEFLNQLEGQRLLLEGEGTWVNGIAAKNQNVVKLLLINYDIQGINSEAVPVTFKNLPNGSYLFNQRYLFGSESARREIIQSGNFQTTIILQPNTAAILELRKLGN